VLVSAISALSEWAEFYVIVGTSAGALAGLMFVVIARRAERRSQAIEEVEAYATPTVVHFTTVVILGGIITVPEQTELSLGLCFAAAGLAGLAYSVWVTFQARRTSYADVLTDWIWRCVLPCLGYAGLWPRPLCSGGTQPLPFTSWPRQRFSSWPRGFTTHGTRPFGSPATMSDTDCEAIAIGRQAAGVRFALSLRTCTRYEVRWQSQPASVNSLALAATSSAVVATLTFR
jgi:hypothetical protein